MASSIKKNTVFNGIKTFSSIIFPLITFPYVSRTLLVNNVGKVSFGASFVSYFSLIASLGVGVYAIRECSKARDNRQSLSTIASEIFSINIFTTIFSYILLFLSLIFYTKIYDYRVLILIQSSSILFVTLGTDWINTAMEDFKYITIRTVSFQILSLILLFLFVKEPNDYIKYAIITVISSSGANISNILYRKKYCDIHFTLQTNFIKHFRPIVYLFVMLLAQTIFNNVDMTMLGIMKGDYEVGIYSTAYKISYIISTMVSTLLWVIMPRMSYYFKKNDFDEINNLLSKAFNFYTTFGFACVIGAIMLSNEIVYLVAGENYASAAPVLIILMLAVFFDIIGGMFLGNSILLPSGREKYFMFVCVVTALVNAVLNYILIPRYSEIAAAITTLICRIIMFILLLLRVDKRISIHNIFKIIFDAVTGCIIIAITCLCFSAIDNVVLKIILSVPISVILYFIYMIFRKNVLFVDLINNFARKSKLK